jgi:hypothetical protein
MFLAGREPAEHIRDSDPHVANARTAAALSWLDRNDVLVIHGTNLASFSRERSSLPLASRRPEYYLDAHGTRKRNIP